MIFKWRRRSSFIRRIFVVHQPPNHGDLIVVRLRYGRYAKAERHHDQWRRRTAVVEHRNIGHVVALKLNTNTILQNNADNNLQKARVGKLVTSNLHQLLLHETGAASAIANQDGPFILRSSSNVSRGPVFAPNM